MCKNGSKQVHRPGDKLDLYFDSGKLEGEATLIEKIDSWRTQEPYPHIERCLLCRRQENRIKERWLVFVNGFVTARWVPVFHSYGTIKIKTNDISSSDPGEEEEIY